MFGYEEELQNKIDLLEKQIRRLAVYKTIVEVCAGWLAGFVIYQVIKYFI